MARLYMKIKIDGKWNMFPANTPFENYALKALCECTFCRPCRKSHVGHIVDNNNYCLTCEEVMS